MNQKTVLLIYLDIECHLHGLPGDVDCTQYREPEHTELNFLHAKDLTLLFGLTSPSLKEPDKQKMNFEESVSDRFCTKFVIISFNAMVQWSPVSHA